jgi:hypothetical protein
MEDPALVALQVEPSMLTGEAAPLPPDLKVCDLRQERGVVVLYTAGMPFRNGIGSSISEACL